MDATLDGIPLVGTVRHCQDWTEAQGMVGARSPDVLILSDLAEIDGALGQSGGTRPKILLILHSTDLTVQRFAGPFNPDGFLILGELSARALEDALRQLVAGQVPMPAPLARELIQRANGLPVSARERNGSLTVRENEALALLAQGLSNKQIARRLSISTHGAKRIVASVLLKLGAPNRTAAVVTAIQRGLIQR
ncbi:LuxR C-terminal-related transcriptional regulator [Streptomyces sp. NPDC056716]|uniref:LuxR C-terminal-related transcriptional regulator n=1 Tax=unclassified Streptomyces TaxID=2593676 RepID=UPI003698055C